MTPKLFGQKPKAHSKFIVIPVPWEGTVSYKTGTSLGPQALIDASEQIDLWDVEFGSLEHLGIQLVPPDPCVLEWNQMAMEARKDLSKDSTQTINQLSGKINEYVLQKYKQHALKDNVVVFLGGEHSIALNGFQGSSQKTDGDYSILQIDAHFDLRQVYQGYVYSHACVFHNVLKSPFAPKTLVQVGIRDFCRQEQLFAESLKKQVFVFYDRYLKGSLHRGQSWDALCQEILKPLHHNVHISLDIDGLSPELCPGTGTPVPGGMDFNQLVSLLKHIALNKKIVGMDLVEVGVSPHDREYNGNVAMRVLYKMLGFAALSQKWIKPQALF